MSSIKVSYLVLWGKDPDYKIVKAALVEKNVFQAILKYRNGTYWVGRYSPDSEDDVIIEQCEKRSVITDSYFLYSGEMVSPEYVNNIDYSFDYSFDPLFIGLKIINSYSDSFITKKDAIMLGLMGWKYTAGWKYER